MVQLGGTDGPPTVARVASPRLRLEIPGSPSLVHGRPAALATEDLLSRRRDWTEEHSQTYPRPFF